MVLAPRAPGQEELVRGVGGLVVVLLEWLISCWLG